jgi:hypothetical protein
MSGNQSVINRVEESIRSEPTAQLRGAKADSFRHSFWIDQHFHSQVKYSNHHDPKDEIYLWMMNDSSG